MNKLLEFLKGLLDLSDDQVPKAEKELKNVEKLEDKIEEIAEIQEDEKKEGMGEKDGKMQGRKEEMKKTEPKGDEKQSAGATSNTTEGVEETVNKEDYKKLQDELAAVKTILENTKAEQAKEKRDNKVKSVKDCLDYDYLATLLDGVEDKDFDSKVEAIKKDKAYLFKSTDTKGFNPATPSSTLSGVEAAFYELNPSLRPSSNSV